MKLIGEYYIDNNIRYIGKKKERYYGFADKKLNILKSGGSVVFHNPQEIINYDFDRHSLKIYKKIWI